MTGTELDRFYYTIDADTSPYLNKMKDLNVAVDGTGGNLQKHLNKSAEGAHALHRGLEVNRRELLYMGREIATGDLARLPSTLILIGTHMAGLTSASILMATAIAAPFALMITAAFQAESAIYRVNRAIAATGNASGVTMSDVLVSSRSAGGDISERAGLDMASRLIGGGSVPGSLLTRGIQASSAYGKLTGEGDDKAADKISEIMRDPAKAAAELHAQLHLLTDAEALRIEGLKDRTAQEKALFDGLIARGKDLEDKTWSLSKTFDGFGAFLSNLWFHTGTSVTGHGRTDAEVMANLDATRASIVHQGSLAGPNALANIDKRRGDLHYKMRMEQEAATKAAEQTAKDQKAEESRSAGALSIQKYRDDVRIAGMAPRDRDLARAKADAARTYQSNLNNPDMVQYAGGIQSGQISAAQAQIAQSRKENLELTQQSAAAEVALAGAYRTSAAAGMAMDATNKAHAEYLKGNINNENAYADALMREAEAQREVKAAQEDLKRGNENDELQLEISLLGIDEDLRNKKIALLRAENQLIQEGWDLSTDAGKSELASRQALVEKNQDLLKLQKDVTQEQQNELSVSRDLVQLLSGGGSLSSLIMKLGVTNPLDNALTKAFTGTAGHAPTAGSMGNIFSKLFGGSGGAGGAGAGMGGFMKSLFAMFGGGGAWSNGVRYAASGMVLGGATAFNAPGGPVIGGELGPNSEALMPLARGPGGVLGVRAHGGGGRPGVTVNQYLSVHPDVSAIARAEVVKMMPSTSAAAVSALDAAIKRGFVPGGNG